MKDINFKGSKIALVIGLLLWASQSVQTNKPHDPTGMVIVFGTLAYISRMKQMKDTSSKWLIVVELLTIIPVGIYFFRGISTGLWYEKPISYGLIPVWILLAYFVAWLKYLSAKKIKLPSFLERKIIPTSAKNTKHIVTEKDLINLEKISELKRRGAISKSEFLQFKKQILH